MFGLNSLSNVEINRASFLFFSLPNTENASVINGENVGEIQLIVGQCEISLKWNKNEQISNDCWFNSSTKHIGSYANIFFLSLFSQF